MRYYLINFKTESFEFRIPNDSEEEKELINKLISDDLTKQFVPELLSYYEETKRDIRLGIVPIRYTLIIYMNNVPIGIVSLYDLINRFVISHAIAPNFRGNRYIEIVKRELYNYIFTIDESIEKILGYIGVNNNNNIKSISRMQDYEIDDIIDSKNGEHFYEVTKYNPNFKICDNKFR